MIEPAALARAELDLPRARQPQSLVVRKRGDGITIDLTGSADEVETGYNVPFEGSLLVSCYYAIRTILLDETTFPEHVPQNDGVFRPVKVIANAFSAGFHLIAHRALPRPLGSSERVTR